RGRTPALGARLRAGAQGGRPADELESGGRRCDAPCPLALFFAPSGEESARDGVVSTQRTGRLRTLRVSEATFVGHPALAGPAARGHRDRRRRAVVRPGGIPAAAAESGRIAAPAGAGRRARRRKTAIACVA